MTILNAIKYPAFSMDQVREFYFDLPYSIRFAHIAWCDYHYDYTEEAQLENLRMLIREYNDDL